MNKNLKIIISLFVIWLSLNYFLLINFNKGYEALLLISSFSILFNLYGFYREGGTFITPLSVYFLYSSLLYGYAPLSDVISKSGQIYSKGNYMAVFMLLITNYIIMMKKSNPINEHEINLINDSHLTKPMISEEKKMKFVLILFLIVFILGLRYSEFKFLSPLVLYLLTIIIFSSTRIKKRQRNYVIGFVTYIIYVLLYFNGFGRINLVTLLMSILMIVNLNHSNINIKKYVVIMFYPMILIGSLLRGGSIDSLTAGIASIVSPYTRLVDIINLSISGQLNYYNGRTILAAFLVVIPRKIWKTKPWNFNREITYIFAPQYVQYGHSEAGLLLAEFVFNFSAIGVILYTIFLFKLLGKMNTFYIKQNVNSYKVVNKTVIIVLISSGLMNLMWGGFSTFINRDGFRLIMAFCINTLGNLLFRTGRRAK